MSKNKIYEIIDKRSDLQNDKNYELYDYSDSEIILHEVQKKDPSARYLNTKTLTY